MLRTLDERLRDLRTAFWKRYETWYRTHNNVKWGDKISQDKLADPLGVSQSTYSRGNMFDSIFRIQANGNIGDDVLIDLLFNQNKNHPSLDLHATSSITESISTDTFPFISSISSTHGKFLTDSLHGVSWFEYIPGNIPIERVKEIEKAIRVFRAGVNGVDPEEIKSKEGNWEHLRRLIKAAFEGGYIRITDVRRDRKKEQKLISEFGLEQAIVADVNNTVVLLRAEFVAFLAARDAFGTLEDSTRVGLDSGYTVLRMAELSMPSASQFRGTTWIPLIAYQGSNSTHSANYIARFLERKFPGSEVVNFPYVNESASIEDKKTKEKIMEQASKLSSLFITVQGINRISSRGNTGIPDPEADFRTSDYEHQSRTLYDIYYSDFAQAGVQNKFGGSFLGMMLDKDGNEMKMKTEMETKALQQKLSQFACHIGLDHLRATKSLGSVWVVAANRYKAKDLEMVIKSKLANAVVIDREIADILLNL